MKEKMKKGFEKQDNKNIEAEWEMIRDTINEVAEKTIGYRKNKKGIAGLTKNAQNKNKNQCEKMHRPKERSRYEYLQERRREC